MNNAGILPVDTKVLIKPHKVEEKTQGGIIMAATTVEKEQLSEVKATVIAIGGNAFADWGDGVLPKVGDHIMFAKYAGLVCEGLDGEEYRAIQDDDIVAILEKKK